MTGVTERGVKRWNRGGAHSLSDLRRPTGVRVPRMPPDRPVKPDVGGLKEQLEFLVRAMQGVWQLARSKGGLSLVLFQKA